MAIDTEISLDGAIRQAYVEIGISADKVVANLQNRQPFASRVRALMKPPTISDDEICERLLAIRKRGQDKGGLPRLKRAYYGRGSGKIKNPR